MQFVWSKIENRGKTGKRILFHCQTPARPFTCSCFGHFKNHFVKKSWLLISLVTLFFFHMMEALSGTQKLRNGFKKGDTTELLNWKKKKSSNDISFTRVAPSYVTEMLLLYRPWRSLRSASKKLLGWGYGCRSFTHLPMELIARTCPPSWWSYIL